MDINENDFRRIDLNLLVVFSALMRERSVSAAAKRLFLGQPAVSAALKRLRELFADELFVRTGSGMEPTARALEVAERIGPSLTAIRDAIVEPALFDPATANQTFRIGTTDAVEVALLPRLMARLCKEAPGCRLVARPPNAIISAREAIDADEIDVAIAPVREPASWQRQRELFDIEFVALFDAKRLGLKPPLTIEQYLSYPHLLTSFRGDLQGFVDELLAARGLSRRVILGTSHFGTLPLVLKQTDTLATLPNDSATTFAEQFGLSVSPLPFPVEPMRLSLLWSARQDQDPAMRWFRDLLVACADKSIKPQGKPGKRR